RREAASRSTAPPAPVADPLAPPVSPPDDEPTSPSRLSDAPPDPAPVRAPFAEAPRSDSGSSALDPPLTPSPSQPHAGSVALRTALTELFGYDQFRPGQEEVVRHVLAGRSVLATMPTGRGKSLCFQLPAMLLPRVTVVISPLIALMQDQLEG